MRLSSAPQTSKAPAIRELREHAELLRVLHDHPDDAMMKVGRAALVLGVTANTLNHWRSDGKPPPFVKFGTGRTSIVRYRMGDLRKFLAANTYTDTATALDAATSLMRVDFHVSLPDDENEELGEQVETDTVENGTPGSKPPSPPSNPPAAPPVVHTEGKPRRDDMLDAVAPFWFCKPYVLDSALSRRTDFREHFLSERVKVEWLTWRKALGLLWLEEPVWERRVAAARVKRSGFELGEVITEHEARVTRDGSSLPYNQLLRYLGLEPRPGIKPDSKTATSYIP